MEQQDLRVEFIDATWPRFEEVQRLLHDVLYRDFGLGWDHDWRQPLEDGSVLAIALFGEKLAGTALLLGQPGEPERRLRQLAVDCDCRTRGIGRVLIEALEAKAAEQGAETIWLNARESAFPFYERLGYEYVGEMFTSELTGIPHRAMRKWLGS